MFFSKIRLILSIIIGLLLSLLIANLVNSVLMKTADRDENIRSLKGDVAILLEKMGDNPFPKVRPDPDYRDEIDKIGKGMSLQYVSSHNRNIALAKVKINLKRYQEDSDTINLSKKSYRTEKWVIKITWIIAICGLIITIPFGLLLLYVVTAVWFFILNRISELSNAIQGKR